MINTKIMILEESGEIDEIDRVFADHSALSRYACRFVGLFIGDTCGRVVRIIDADTHQVLLNFDSDTGRFTVAI